MRIVSGLVALSIVFGAVTSASANTAYNLAAQDLGSDSFDNYDFQSPSVSSYNVDQPVTMIFTNNADKNKVYDALSGGYSSSGSDQYGRLNNSAGWFYAATGGKKTPAACAAWDTHYRLYGDPSNNDRMWTPSFGFYVIGTTHMDYNDRSVCGGTKYYGWNESAESNLMAYIAGVTSWTRYANNYDMQNPNSGRWDGCCQYFSNNATASWAVVP
jgi:hypothetical protein